MPAAISTEPARTWRQGMAQRGGSDDDAKKAAGPGASGAGEARTGDFLPPLEFNSIILLLYLPALIQLGLLDDPQTGERRENLDLAKRNIDLLDLLRDRTKGNLEEEESRFLDDALSQLKMVYLKKKELIKM
jgi:hypothetical protein